ncbi:hypothetical protein O0L34_g5886 [Tuta absoluta]|nr:hypothetical protein O0L34_g5886 [Tuta absoluta]
MDRFIVRETRQADYPQAQQQGNQMMQFPPSMGNNRNLVPETMYFGGYGAEFPVRSPGFMGVTHVNAPHFSPNLSTPNQNVLSGIDRRYLAAYDDNNAAYIAGHRQQMERDQTTAPPNGPGFAGDYQNRPFIGVDRNTRNTFCAQVATGPNDTTTVQILTKNSGKENEEQKTSIQFPVPLKTRTERLRDLHKTGARVFSGPVEKVLKWHKTLQELGLLVLYEIVAKCVSVQSGKGCAKTLVVRDDSGPAIQVVYYEIDFLLPDLKPPCMVRVIGRMMPGTCRLQAFSVRLATGDDVSTLPRRAAVAAHHVSKLCKEFAHP